MSTKIQPAITSTTATAMSVGIYRRTDKLWYDFADGTFKATPTTKLAAMAAADAQEPDLWTLDVDTTGNAAWTNDNYTYFFYDLTSGTAVRVDDETEYVQGGQGNLPPSTASLSPSDITSIADTTAAAVGSSVATATATRILDTEQTGGGSIRKLLRALGSALTGKLTQAADGSTSSLTDWADQSTERISSVNGATVRTPTIKP